MEGFLESTDPLGLNGDGKDGGDGENKTFNGSVDDNTMNFGVQAEAWW